VVRSFFIAIDGGWLARYPKFARRIGEQHLFPLGHERGGLDYGCKLLLKFRDARGAVIVDEDAELTSLKDSPFLRSSRFCTHLQATQSTAPSLLLYFEGTPKEARCVVHALKTNLFVELEQDDPALRLGAYGLPPADTAMFDAEHLVEALHARLSRADPELFGVHVSNFLDAPHILVPLFEHVLGLSSQEQIEFPVLLKKVAEQLRTLLLDNSSSVRIAKVRRDHQGLWADVLGDRISFLDGGVARIAGMPGSEPLAMRVGIYTVRPGVEEPREREEWALKPYVIGDILEVPLGSRPHNGEPPDRKRLQEAARYVLEPLTALAYLREHRDVRVLFVHGPLVNQFLQYDEGEPNFIPCLSPSFLERFGITPDEIGRAIKEIPAGADRRTLWNQFMAVYGYVQQQLFGHDRPIAGVVERTRGKWLALEVLRRLVDDHVVKESYAAKVRDILDRYDISDDFLFGCVLTEGEFITPVAIQKNNPRRARDQWKGVVEQYPKPFASLIKTSETSFPYRVELNKVAAERNTPFVFRLLYHTSLLLPRYAFPVGLDIVDRYAKVPDWISRGISARLSAEVLRRALRTGDPRLVSQVRQFLARTPRDFFFRPEM